MKKPKTVKGTNIIKALTKNGYEIKRQKGSHVSLCSPDGKTHITVVVPETSIGIYKKISRITGIPIEEFY